MDNPQPSSVAQPAAAAALSPASALAPSAASSSTSSSAASSLSNQPTLRTSRSISSVVARPLSILSTRSAHRREPADSSSSTSGPSSNFALPLSSDDANQLSSVNASNRGSFISSRSTKRDSRGLLAAQVEMNFEEALLNNETLHLSTSASGVVAESTVGEVRPSSMVEAKAVVEEYDDEELLADTSLSTESTVSQDSLGTEVAVVVPDVLQPVEDQQTTETEETSAVTQDGPTPSPTSPSLQPPVAGSPAEVDSVSSSGKTGSRPGRKDSAPPSSFPARTPSPATSSTVAGSPTLTRQPSPRPSSLNLHESDRPSLLSTPPPPPAPAAITPGHPQGIIPPSPHVVPPTPTHPPPEFKRRGSGTPSFASSGSGGKKERMIRTGTRGDLASLARSPDLTTSPTTSHEESTSSRSTPRPLALATFTRRASIDDQELPPQTPPKPSSFAPLPVVSTSPASINQPAMVRSQSGGVESDLSTDDWEKLALSPASPPRRQLAPDSTTSNGIQTTPGRTISYSLGSGIGSTSSNSAAGEGKPKSSMKSRARNAFSKMFSTPTKHDDAAGSGGAGGGFGGGGGAYGGMPKKGSPRHFGSLSSSNLSAYAGRKNSSSSVGVPPPGTGEQPRGPNGHSSATLPSRSTSSQSFAALQGLPQPSPPPSAPGSSPTGRATAWNPPTTLGVTLDKTTLSQPPLMANSTSASTLAPDAGTSVPMSATSSTSTSSTAAARRRSMSVSDAPEPARSWEYDVEGLLDGIIGGGKGNGKDPQQAAGLGRKSTVTKAFSTSTSPRFPSVHTLDQEWSPSKGERSLYQDLPTDGTVVTTITAGKGKSTRSVVGSIFSNSPSPSSRTSDLPSTSRRASTQSVPSIDVGRTDRRPSVVSLASSTGIPRQDGTWRTDSPSQPDRSPRSTRASFDRGGSNLTPSSSSANLQKSVMRPLPAIPASPSGQSFGLSGSPYTVPSPVAVRTASLRQAQMEPPTVNLASDDDEDNGSSVPSAAYQQRQTIRLVPASPSPRLPPLPNSSPMTTPSKFILRRDSSSSGGPDRPPTPTRRTLADKFEVGLGIAEPVPQGEVRLGKEINLMDTDEEAQDLVRRIREEDDTLKWVNQNRVAEFLGGRARLNRLACQHYMSHFDFKGQKLDAAIRTLTSQLYFRAETQELDRIIEAFSERYFECNPTAVYGSAGVIHQVVYGLLLLNTDLHVADQDRRMTRPQFVNNVMSSIRTDLETTQAQIQSNPVLPSTLQHRQSTPRSSVADLPGEDGASSRASEDIFYEAGGPDASSSASVNVDQRGSISVPRELVDSAPVSPPSLLSNPSSTGTIGTVSPGPGSTVSSVMIHTPNASIATDLAGLRKGSIGGSRSISRAWNNEMESALKDLYTSVKSHQILQPMDEATSSDRRPSMTLSPSSNSSVTRQRSFRSPSSSTTNVNKRSSIRFGAFGASLASIGVSTAPSSYGGRLSPTPSHATSMNEGFDQAPSAPGFASNLTHTVIKETDNESVASSMSSSTVDDPLLDEELALLGAPWAKEGMISRKSYLDADGKRARDKNWHNLFTVVQKGNIQMYTFENTSSSVNKSSVGGGNWLSNAQLVDEFSLAHCVAKVLPPPGYNRSRPHVFTLDQPDGSQSFFQVGTDSLADEWTSTCNYRAARMSKEPLTGGVSNMEYGWGRHALADSESGSVMSSRKRMFSSGGQTIMEWKPPQQPQYPSQLDEEAQLEGLRKYAGRLNREMEEHVSVEKYLIPVRQANGLRAHENYRRKLKFLHEEQFKYQTYIAALEDGLRLRISKRGEIRLNKTLEKAGRRSASRDD